MKVVELKSKASKENKLFYDVCSRIYSEDQTYIPHIKSDIEKIFDERKNKRFQNGMAKRWIFLDDKGNAFGRIAAFYEDKNEKRWGGWGFYECVNDPILSKTVIETAESWLKNHKCKIIQAPINFGSRDSYWGLLISSNSMPSYRENYNPSYYQSQIESLGYEREIEQTTYQITHATFQAERFIKIAQRTMGNNAYDFRNLEFSNLSKYVKDFVTIYNEAWAFHEDFTPLTHDELYKEFKEMKPAMLKELAVFAYHEERPIGFYVNILELNEIFKYFNGELTLWNKLRFLLSKNRIKRARGIIFGIVPDFHNKGVEAGLIMKTNELVKKVKQLKTMELAWIGDFNPKMLSMLKAVGAELTKVHHTYKKKISF